jgi:hypothetical protein
MPVVSNVTVAKLNVPRSNVTVVPGKVEAHPYYHRATIEATVSMINTFKFCYAHPLS